MAPVGIIDVFLPSPPPRIPAGGAMVSPLSAISFLYEPRCRRPWPRRSQLCRLRRTCSFDRGYGRPPFIGLDRVHLP